MTAPAGRVGFLALLGAMMAVQPLSTDMYLPSLPALRAALGADVGAAQLTLSLFLIGFACGQLVYGPLSDRFGRRPVLLGGLGLYTLASIGCASAGSIDGLIALRLLQGAGACAGPVLARAIVRDLFDRAEGARILAQIATVMGLAPALGPIAGGFLQEAIGWRGSLVVLALFGIIVLLASWRTLTESNTRRDPGATDPATLLRNYLLLARHRVFLGYALTVAFTYGALFSFISGSSFVFVELLGVPPRYYGMLFGAIAFSYMTGAYASSRLVRRLGIDRLMRAGTVLAAFSSAVLLAAAMIDSGGIVGVAALILPATAMFACFGLIMSNGYAGAVAPFPQMAGAASALLGFTQMVLASASGAAIGRLHDATARPMAAGMGVMALSAVLAYYFLIWRKRAPSASAAE